MRNQVDYALIHYVLDLIELKRVVESYLVQPVAHTRDALNCYIGILSLAESLSKLRLALIGGDPYVSIAIYR